MKAIVDAGERELLQRAFEASYAAYAPYSKFYVGAALRSTKGTYVGANVENGSYGLTSCAERNAVFAAVSAEGGPVQIEAVAVYARSPGRRLKTASPCGACRQVLAEFGRRDARDVSRERALLHDDRRRSASGRFRAGLTPAPELGGAQALGELGYGFEQAVDVGPVVVVHHSRPNRSPASRISSTPASSQA